MKYLITPSLHDSFRWYRKIEDKSKEEILDMLCKKDFKKTDAMQRGIDFEDAVYAYTKGQMNGEPSAYRDCVEEIGNIVKDGLWQERVYKDVEVQGSPYLLYGKSDIIKRDWVYDIKFTSNYEVGKYTGSIQHLTYMYGSGIEKFSYLITDGRNVWREDYFWDDYCEPQLMKELNALMNFIYADNDFKTEYLNNWKCKY